MEKIKLNDEQAEKIVKQYCQGDIFGFEEIEKIVKELHIEDYITRYTIYDLIKDTIAVNKMYVLGCQETIGLVEFENEIGYLYDKLKDKLFNCFDYDFEPLWKKYW